jgi:ASC-1-like (ASCH) protein
MDRYHVAEPYFSYIVDGKKRFEGRSYKSRMAQQKIDDIITLYNGMQEVKVKIVDKHYFENVYDMLDVMGVKTMVVHTDDINEGCDIYAEFADITMPMYAIELEIDNN